MLNIFLRGRKGAHLLLRIIELSEVLSRSERSLSSSAMVLSYPIRPARSPLVASLSSLMLFECGCTFLY
jgi:hypothetical protein